MEVTSMQVLPQLVVGSSPGDRTPTHALYSLHRLSANPVLRKLFLSI